MWGAVFANMEMDVVLRTVLRHFTIEITTAPGEKYHSRGVAFYAEGRRQDRGPSALRSAVMTAKDGGANQLIDSMTAPWDRQSRSHTRWA